MLEFGIILQGNSEIGLVAISGESSSARGISSRSSKLNLKARKLQRKSNLK